MSHTADYIVVGSGSSGSVVAARLSETPSCKVLLLEAGGTDKTLSIQMPAASYIYALKNPRYDWCYEAEPDPTRNGRADYIPRGKVLGGTSSINGMCYVRGQPDDFNDWADLGCKGWDFQNVLPYFKKAEHNENGASEFRGTGGPLKVSNLRTSHPVSDLFLEASRRAGFPILSDINAPPQNGMGYLQATQTRGHRHSAARAYLWPAMRRPNLSVVKHAHVTQILFEGRRAVGVTYKRGGRMETVKASRGVVLSAGTIASPQLLMLSGIGPGAELSRHGIPVLHDSVGVGQNYQDHAGIVQGAWIDLPTYNTRSNLFYKALYGAMWLLLGKGPGTTPDCHLIGFASTDKQRARSDIQYHFGPVGYEFTHQGPVLFDKPSVTGFTNLSRPKSRGWIKLKSADPFNAPAIQPNLFSDARDIDSLREGAKILRRVFDTSPFKEHVLSERTPGLAVQTDAEWRDYILSAAEGIYHPAGTCKMGSDDASVVDETLRVRGVEGLFVVDASIMPTVTSANLNANCIMIGEKFVDMLQKAA